jgi:hypothetical protein
MASKLSQWRRLSAAQRWVFCQAVFLLPASGMGLRLLGFRRCLVILTRLAPCKSSRSFMATADRDRDIASITRMVAAAARWGFYRGRCLHRSLTLWWLLRRRGIRTEIRIGVRKQDGRFQAHAWVEHEGSPLNDRRDVGEVFRSFEQPLTG